MDAIEFIDILINDLHTTRAALVRAKELERKTQEAKRTPKFKDGQRVMITYGAWKGVVGHIQGTPPRWECHGPYTAYRVIIPGESQAPALYREIELEAA